MSNNVKSPCIKVCKYDEDEVCMGCFRTMDEITGWIFMKDPDRLQVLRDAEDRRRTPKQGKSNYDHYV